MKTIMFLVVLLCCDIVRGENIVPRGNGSINLGCKSSTVFQKKILGVWIHETTGPFDSPDTDAPPNKQGDATSGQLVHDSFASCYDQLGNGDVAHVISSGKLNPVGNPLWQSSSVHLSARCSSDALPHEVLMTAVAQGQAKVTRSYEVIEHNQATIRKILEVKFRLTQPTIGSANRQFHNVLIQNGFATVANLNVSFVDGTHFVLSGYHMDANGNQVNLTPESYVKPVGQTVEITKTCHVDLGVNVGDLLTIQQSTNDIAGWNAYVSHLTSFLVGEVVNGSEHGEDLTHTIEVKNAGFVGQE